MINVFSDLFIVVNGRVETYRFDCCEHILRLRPTNAGQKSQELTPDFWEWWEETVNFILDEHQVDFLIISDTAPSLLQVPIEYSALNETIWTSLNVRSVCQKIFIDDDIEFYENDEKRFEVNYGITRVHKRYYINKTGASLGNEAKQTYKQNAQADDPFVDYLRSEQLPDIIVKDILR